MLRCIGGLVVAIGDLVTWRLSSLASSRFLILRIESILGKQIIKSEQIINICIYICIEIAKV